MSETHHRVKNNLQVISALANLQMLQYPEFVPVQELERLTQYTRSLALVHDLLTQQAKRDASADTLSVRSAIEQLLPMVREMMTADRKIGAEVMDVSLPARQTTALTVLLHELIANAIKHGRGDIEVRFRHDGKTAVLVVQDHGPGFMPGFDVSQSANTGLELVESMAQWDLQGSVHYDTLPGRGGQVRIEFPIPVPA